jgi:hypothetical protein
MGGKHVVSLSRCRLLTLHANPQLFGGPCRLDRGEAGRINGKEHPTACVVSQAGGSHGASYRFYSNYYYMTLKLYFVFMIIQVHVMQAEDRPFHFNRGQSTHY